MRPWRKLRHSCNTQIEHPLPMAKQKRKPSFRANEYSYHAQYSEEDTCYIGQAAEFPGLSALGNTRAAALAEINLVVTEGIKLLQARNQPLPAPLIKRKHSS